MKSIQQMVREDLDARERLGVERYGSALYPHNGRNALRDAYEEALDMACYLRQAIAEQSAAEDRLAAAEAEIELLRAELDTKQNARNYWQGVSLAAEARLAAAEARNELEAMVQERASQPCSHVDGCDPECVREQELQFAAEDRLATAVGLLTAWLDVESAIETGDSPGAETRAFLAASPAQPDASRRTEADQAVLDACASMTLGDDDPDANPLEPQELGEDCYVYTDDQYRIARTELFRRGLKP